MFHCIIKWKHLNLDHLSQHKPITLDIYQKDKSNQVNMMRSYTQSGLLLLALTIAPIVSGSIIPRYAPGQWIELPDGEIAEWVGSPASSSLNVLSGTAKASVAAIASTAPQAVSTVTGGTALSSITSLLVSQEAAKTPAAAAEAPPAPTPAAITHSAVPVQAVSSLLSSEASEAATLSTATAVAAAIPVTTQAAVLEGGKMTVAITNKWPSP